MLLIIDTPLKVFCVVLLFIPSIRQLSIRLRNLFTTEEIFPTEIKGKSNQESENPLLLCFDMFILLPVSIYYKDLMNSRHIREHHDSAIITKHEV